jgi:hypothetical protein
MWLGLMGKKVGELGDMHCSRLGYTLNIAADMKVASVAGQRNSCGFGQQRENNDH